MLGRSVTPALLQPYLKDCGYPLHSRLIPEYRFDSHTVPLAGFYGRPFDTRSACLSVVETAGEGKAAAARCMGLGAPTAFVCRGSVLEWWGLSADGPRDVRSVPAADLDGFFKAHAAELAPESIYSAKLRRPLGKPDQMWFFDVSLMPATERRAGEALHRLVERVIQDLADRLGGQLRSKRNFVDLYKTVFWLLAAKLLHDKGVDNFKRISLTDVHEVFRRVGRYYADVDELPPGGRAWLPAIERAAVTVASFGFLGNTSTESLAYLYETALIDAKPKGKLAQAQRLDCSIRKDLGIHSTPSVLIDHMMAQLWPLIEQHEPENRRVFEPACGPARFLVSAMRWLRDFSGIGEGSEQHQYLRDHLHGIEIDPFARELAKLSLTVADVPYGNKWRVDKGEGDMFAPGVLAKAASECTVLLANPPYETFSSTQRDAYKRAGAPVTALTKAVEMLKRSLPALPQGAVFGVVVPQGVLHDRESKPVREFLDRECELTEIALFADKLFKVGEHEVAVLMGRRRSNPPASGTLMYRRVRERGMTAFKERLEFSTERIVPRARFTNPANKGLFLPDLPEVWDYLSTQPRVGTQVHVQKGREYWTEERLLELGLLSRKKKAGWIPTVLRARDDYTIWGFPTRVWLEPSSATSRPRGGGAKPGVAQVILNYARAAREPWRLKAVVDEQGHGVSSRFLVFRPKPGGPTLRVLWAILNSPVANSYAYSFSGKRETLVDEWRDFPLPTITAERRGAIAGAAEKYLALVRDAEAAFMQPKDEDAIRRALIALDAEVLRLYNLPPELERQLLDQFVNVERKGVGCRFSGYDPGISSKSTSLHQLISDQGGDAGEVGRVREHVLAGVVYEFRNRDGVVHVQSPEGMETRLIDARLLRNAGIVYEGQPFELVVRERTWGTTQLWETVLRPMIDAAQFKPSPQRPRADFDKFKRLG